MFVSQLPALKQGSSKTCSLKAEIAGSSGYRLVGDVFGNFLKFSETLM